MPDTKPKTRNTKSTLSVGQALDRRRERLSTCEQRRELHEAEFLRGEEKWHAAVMARVAEDERETVDALLARWTVHQEAKPDLNAAMDALAAEGPPDDAELTPVDHVPGKGLVYRDSDGLPEPADPAPVYTAERMREPLSSERKKIAGMK